MIKTVVYRKWTFEVDFDRTVEVYKKVETRSPEDCGCHDCNNFASNRENIYPQEFKKLLSDFGVDYRREAEIYHIAKLENGLHHYGGRFHFKGKMIQGRDGKIALGTGGYTFDTEEITDNFGVTLTKGGDLVYFDQSEVNELIQIEFIANSEWIIEKEFESE